MCRRRTTPIFLTRGISCSCGLQQVKLQVYKATLPVLGRAVRPETTQPSVVAQLARVKLLMLFAGEGGAGTWSDGKLTTKVGRNSDPVRRVLHTLYTFGAPQVQ